MRRRYRRAYGYRPFEEKKHGNADCTKYVRDLAEILKKMIKEYRAVIGLKPFEETNMKNVVQIILCFLCLMFAGCVFLFPKPSLEVNKSAKIVKEYKNVVLYPFITGKGKEAWAFTSFIPIKNKIAITPPIDSDFTISMDAKVFTDMMTSNLMKSGFSLREGLFEIMSDEESKKQNFSISTDILSELRTKHQVEGIIIGDVVFNRPDSRENKLKIRFVQARLIDSETLEVIKTATYTYDFGEDLNVVAQKISDALSIQK